MGLVTVALQVTVLPRISVRAGQPLTKRAASHWLRQEMLNSSPRSRQAPHLTQTWQGRALRERRAGAAVGT
jgi:hypothetical protein